MRTSLDTYLDNSAPTWSAWSHSDDGDPAPAVNTLPGASRVCLEARANEGAVHGTLYMMMTACQARAAGLALIEAADSLDALESAVPPEKIGSTK